MPDELRTRYGIAEWYGHDFTSLGATQRVVFAKHALGESDAESPVCPFQPNHPPCSKKGGVCSIQQSEVRRPDWRSSSAKRLMPQLEIKAPTLRRWGAKLAVAVDRPFFNAVGGTSDQPSHDLNEGDIIWLVTHLERAAPGTWRLARDHWEVLTLEDSNKRLQAAETVSRENFETALRSRLRPL